MSVGRVTAVTSRAVQVHTLLTEVGGAIVVTVDGAVDLTSVGRLRDDLTRAIRRHPGVTVLVDLDGVGVLDDAGLGVLLGAAATARDGGGDLEVVATRPAIRERLARSRFDCAVDVRSSIT